MSHHVRLSTLVFGSKSLYRSFSAKAALSPSKRAPRDIKLAITIRNPPITAIVTCPQPQRALSTGLAIRAHVPPASTLGGRKDLWRDWTPPRTGFLSLLPSSWAPYAELMRVEKPGGLYGFYFPYLIGLGYGACIATPAVPPPILLSTAGTLLVWNIFLRGAACTINDNLDRDYDRQVARCRTRPIARGAVTPQQGHIWYAAQTACGVVAVSQLPHAWHCLLHAVAIQSLVSVYPLSKRVTDFPQLVLSVPLAWAIVMSCASLGVDPFTAGNTAVAGATGTLVLSHAIWIVVFDYVNACQDTPDDVRAGVRSMAVRYRHTEAFIGVLGTAQVACLLATGLLAGLGPLYFVGACGGNAALLLAMAMTAKRSRPESCAWWFSYGSLLVGGTTVLGLGAEYVSKLRRQGEDDAEADAEVEDSLRR